MGKELLVGIIVEKLEIWDSNGRPLGQPFEAYEGSIIPVEMSADGQTIVIGGNDGTVGAWDSNGRPLGQLFLGHRGTVHSVAISSDGQTILSGSSDGTVRMWDRMGQPQSGPVQVWESELRHQEVPLIPYLIGDFQDKVSSLAISQDGQTIVSGSSYSRVQLLDHDEHPGFEAEQGTLHSVAISTDGANNC